MIEAPSLKGPLTTLAGHGYRMAQHLKVQFKYSADKPIDLWNCHSPSSSLRPLTFTVRQHVLQYFGRFAGPMALIGGDLNSSRHSLDAELKEYSGFRYLYESDHKHGDIMIARGVDADSVPCDVDSASDAHRMCVCMVRGKLPPSAGASGSAGKPGSAWGPTPAMLVGRREVEWRAKPVT